MFENNTPNGSLIARTHVEGVRLDGLDPSISSHISLPRHLAAMNMNRLVPLIEKK